MLVNSKTAISSGPPSTHPLLWITNQLNRAPMTPNSPLYKTKFRYINKLNHIGFSKIHSFFWQNKGQKYNIHLSSLGFESLTFRLMDPRLNHWSILTSVALYCKIMITDKPFKLTKESILISNEPFLVLTNLIYQIRFFKNPFCFLISHH